MSAKSVAQNLWSRKVKTHWHPHEGFFKLPAKKIARGLLHASDSPGQAVKRLSFFINRAGKNLHPEDRVRLHHAMRILESKMG